MKLIEKLFIAVVVLFGVVLIMFLLTSLPTAENILSPSKLPLSFMTTTISSPLLENEGDLSIPVILEEHRGGFGWSSAPAREDSSEETDDEENEDIPPCVDENNNGVCDEEEEIPPCPDANSNDLCDDEEPQPCSDANADGICDEDELPEDQETTLQAPPPNFKVAFIADSGYGNNFRQVLELIRDEGAEMVIHMGDLGYDEGNDEVPRLWLDRVEAVLDATAPNGVFPYFFSMGNHDVSHWNDENGYREILEDRFSRLGIEYNGDPALLGARTSFIYNGLAVALVAPGEDQDVAGENHWLFIEQQLEHNSALWDVCAWHKNMQAMQVGGKGDETGWEVYETCREVGAIIATGHEHSYGRTQVLSDMVNQEIVDNTSPYKIEPGQTFAFHSGLGGASVREQERCLPSSPPYGCNGEWASIYTENQSATYGALFIEFNVDNDPRRAHGYFKNINEEIIDEFEIYNNAPEVEQEEEESIIPPAGFVYAEGTELRLDGEPYQFIGFNVYGLANDETIFDCGPSADNGRFPDEYLNALFSNLRSRGVNALRFWAFQSFTNGGTDFSSIDRVINYARQYNIKLIPALENHWDDCTEGGEKEGEWYAERYREPYGDYALSYPEYVQQIVSRYENEPTILMWQLLNEAESSDAEALYNFTVDISELIHSLDQNHLVSLGTIGRGQAGTQNEHFVRLHNIDTIDIVEAHDYNRQDEAWPSSGSNSINRAWSVAQELGKPFFIGEAGISVDSDTTAVQRADLFEAKIATAVEHGVVGYLIWEWDNSVQNFGEGCGGGYCVTEGDPVLDVIERYSQ